MSLSQVAIPQGFYSCVDILCVDSETPRITQISSDHRGLRTTPITSALGVKTLPPFLNRSNWEEFYTGWSSLQESAVQYIFLYLCIKNPITRVRKCLVCPQLPSPIGLLFSHISTIVFLIIEQYCKYLAIERALDRSRQRTNSQLNINLRLCSKAKSSVSHLYKRTH